ncbi:MAG: type II secretion system F family protein [Candidatus Krumholzibacteriia bacterium]
MKEFRYSALSSQGHRVNGIRTADDAGTLSMDLLEQGLIMLRCRPTMGSLGQMFSKAGRAGRREQRDFTQHMATCLAAGIPAVAALGDYQERAEGAFADIIADIRNDVSSGTALDDAFARHPFVFGPVYLAMVSAGQKSGNLDGSFEELVAYLEWQENLRAQTTQALIYPAILVVGIIGLFLLLMLFVIPRFSAMFAAVDFELPTITRRMMALGAFLGHWWWLLAIIGAGLWLGGKLGFATERGRYWRDRTVLALPVLGSFARKLALSRFAKTMAIILGSGLDLLRALDLMQGVVGNSVVARQLGAIRQRVATGETLQQAFKDADVFPPLVQRLVSVGEKTGSLDTSLRQASTYLDREIPRDLKKAFTIFEALIIAVLGVMVCVAALSLLMPIMQIKASLH